MFPVKQLPAELFLQHALALYVFFKAIFCDLTVVSCLPPILPLGILYVGNKPREATKCAYVSYITISYRIRRYLFSQSHPPNQKKNFNGLINTPCMVSSINTMQCYFYLPTYYTSWFNSRITPQIPYDIKYCVWSKKLLFLQGI